MDCAAVDEYLRSFAVFAFFSRDFLGFSLYFAVGGFFAWFSSFIGTAAFILYEASKSAHTFWEGTIHNYAFFNESDVETLVDLCKTFLFSTCATAANHS